jgi:hypothetical protein
MNFDLSMVFSPAGGIGIIAVIALIMLMVVRLRAALLILGVMLFVGSLAIPAEAAKGDFNRTLTWLSPLQFLRSFVYLFCGVLLTLGTLVHISKLRLASTSMTGLMLMVVASYAGLLNCYHVSFTDGLFTIVSAILTMGTLSVLLPNLLHTVDDFCMMLRVLVFTSIVYSVAVLVQLGIDRAPLIAPNAFRFQGISGNPQFVSVFLAAVITSTVFLIMNDSQKRFKWLYIASACLNVVLLIWTGSRTGAAMTMIGLTGVLFTRMGKALLFAPFLVGGVAGILEMMSASGIDIGFDRLTSTDDTRSGVWRAMIENSLENPVIGAGFRGAGAAENSFLLATASYGFGSLLTLLLLTLLTGVQCLRLLSLRRHVSGFSRRLIDLQFGFYAMYFAGANFEGYLIARISVMLPIFLMFSAITTRQLEIEAGAGEQEADPSAGVFTEPVEGYS